MGPGGGGSGRLAECSGGGGVSECKCASWNLSAPRTFCWTQFLPSPQRQHRGLGGQAGILGLSGALSGHLVKGQEHASRARKQSFEPELCHPVGPHLSHAVNHEGLTSTPPDYI